MRIAIDARGINWYKGTGIGTYTENVLKQLINIDKENYYHIYWSGENYEGYNGDNAKVIMTSRKHHRFFQQNYFPNNILKEKIDIYHVPQNGIGLYENTPCKKIITIHDLIPYVMPETVGKGYLLRFLKEVPSVIEFSDGILTVSEWSKRDVLKFFPIDENKVFVTPLAADSKYTPMDREYCRHVVDKKFNVKKPFLLYIGGFSPRKNVRSLIMAFSKIYKELPVDYDLIIAGSLKDEGNSLKELSENLNMSSKIHFTGFVADELLPVLYNACEVFVYPSLYEGFGLPPLEAMSCRTPVITSNISSIPEVVEDAGILIDPYDTSNLISAMGELLSNDALREEYARKGYEKSKEFSWSKTAEKTLEAYRKLHEMQT